MNDYCIKVINNLVSVSRIVDEELELISINGEVSVPITDFWALFKSKIEYEVGESLAFMIFSNTDKFRLDPEINISEKFSSSHSALKNLVFENHSDACSLTFYPDIDISIENRVLASLEKKSSIEIVTQCDMKIDSLQTFYTKQTRELKK